MVTMLRTGWRPVREGGIQDCSGAAEGDDARDHHQQGYRNPQRPLGHAFSSAQAAASRRGQTTSVRFSINSSSTKASAALTACASPTDISALSWEPNSRAAARSRPSGP